MTRINTLVQGLATNVADFASKSPEDIGKDISKWKPGRVKRRTDFQGLGDGWKKMANGKFKPSKWKKVIRVAESVAKPCSWVAPVFIVGDLIWGDTQDQ